MSQPTADPGDERARIARARAGDESAFAQLVIEHSPRVYGALRRFGLDPQEADEVAQEVFVRAWRGLARFEERSQFSTWLYRIAFNEAQRRLARRPPTAALSRPGDEDAIAALPDAIDAGPQARTLDREFERDARAGAGGAARRPARGRRPARPRRALHRGGRGGRRASGRRRSRAACIVGACSCVPCSSRTSGSSRHAD